MPVAKGLRCPRGHTKLKMIMEITGILCKVCKRIYSYNQIKERP